MLTYKLAHNINITAQNNYLGSHKGGENKGADGALAPPKPPLGELSPPPPSTSE